MFSDSGEGYAEINRVIGWWRNRSQIGGSGPESLTLI